MKRNGPLSLEFDKGLKAPWSKEPACIRKCYRASCLYGFLGATQATENVHKTCGGLLYTVTNLLFHKSSVFDWVSDYQCWIMILLHADYHISQYLIQYKQDSKSD